MKLLSVMKRPIDDIIKLNIEETLMDFLQMLPSIQLTVFEKLSEQIKTIKRFEMQKINF